MRLHVVSDLHLEFAPFSSPCADADVTVLAGDIGVGLAGLEWIVQHWTERPVIYVPGNHEFYGQTLQKLIRELMANAAGTKVHVLDDKMVTLDGVTFVGATLWTDLALYDDPTLSAIAVQVGMADYYQIRTEPGNSRLRPADTQRLHAASRAWLENQCSQRRSEKLVIVTHHAPSARSIHTEYLGDPLSPAFASNLDDVVEASRASLWIHGHIHQRVDYRIGATRVVSNPRGYPGEEVGFDPSFVLEV
jgi:Icc-related predicted phosphoesterase